ncbi:MAG TPA: glucose 1-dehydrogenase [Candidatus Acidoferrales bacterium]|nr:glucose 1-dehydrogenase [Candidatus Acidoferrales bacterium]
MATLEGKVAVITGGTSGIGAGTAEVFVGEGAKVVIAGRRKDRGEKLAQKLGDRATFIQTDVSVESDVEAMINHAVKCFGWLDCLVNNAGRGSQFATIADADLKEFDAVVAVHLRAVLAGMKYAVRAMTPQGSGSIITIASVNGFRAGLGGHYYAAAKAASIHLTRCAAVELGEKGIRVNSISPGMTATGAFGKYSGMTAGEADEADDHPEYAEAAIGAVMSRWQPLLSVARADDIAQAAVFLASDASRMITGHNLVVDGGISAGWPIGAVRPDRELFFRKFQEARSA